MTYVEFLNAFIMHVGIIIEYVGIFIIAVAAFAALYRSALHGWVKDEIQRNFARRLIFGLEFIVASDIIHASLAIDVLQVAQLGGLVLIRVILGYALRKEIGLGK